jgi:NitT/TauT family transport system substrate-binding protein
MRQLVVLALLFSGCRSAPHAEDRVTVVIASQPSAVPYLPHVVAQQLNLYEKAGIRVEVHILAGGTNAVQGLLGGSGEAVMGFFDHPMRLNSHGRKLKAFVAFTRYPQNVLIASPAARRPIREIADLKGALVSVADAGSQQHHFLNRLLLRNGLLPSDVTAIPVGTQAAAVAAFEHGKVDVFNSSDPAATIALRRMPGAVILADARTQEGLEKALGVREYPGATLYSTADWLQRNPDKARKLASALQAALRWMQAHTPEETAELVPPELKLADAALYLEALRSNFSFSRDGAFSAEGAQAAFDLLKSTAANPSDYRFSPSEAYTNEFLAK